MVWITIDGNTRPPPKALTFASFRQEPIPLHEQFKEQPEERQKKVQEQAQLTASTKSRDPRPTSKPQSKPQPKYPPQPSECRHCQEHFDSKNALFRHLEYCKTSRLTSRSTSQSTSRLSSRSRASLVSSSPRSTASSASSVASIESVQLQILGQLHAIQTPKKSIPSIVPQKQPQMPAQTPPHIIYTPNWST